MVLPSHGPGSSQHDGRVAVAQATFPARVSDDEKAAGRLEERGVVRLRGSGGRCIPWGSGAGGRSPAAAGLGSRRSSVLLLAFPGRWASCHPFPWGEKHEDPAAVLVTGVELTSSPGQSLVQPPRDGGRQARCHRAGREVLAGRCCECPAGVRRPSLGAASSVLGLVLPVSPSEGLEAPEATPLAGGVDAAWHRRSLLAPRPQTRVRGRDAPGRGVPTRSPRSQSGAASLTDALKSAKGAGRCVRALSRLLRVSLATEGTCHVVTVPSRAGAGLAGAGGRLSSPQRHSPSTRPWKRPPRDSKVGKCREAALAALGEAPGSWRGYRNVRSGRRCRCSCR